MMICLVYVLACFIPASQFLKCINSSNEVSICSLACIVNVFHIFLSVCT